MALTKILVVDDSKLMHALYDAFLTRYTRAGVKVVHAMNGREALDILGAQPNVGLILLDRYMPEMDGPTFLSQMKTSERFKHLPVVLITTEGHPEKIAECPEEWIEAYLTKPLHPKQMHDQIHRLFPEMEW